MRSVISIEYKEEKLSKAKKRYTITHVLLDDGTEAEYFGSDVKVDDSVECFFHFGKVKCRHTP